MPESQLLENILTPLYDILYFHEYSQCYLLLILWSQILSYNRDLVHCKNLPKYVALCPNSFVLCRTTFIVWKIIWN